MAARRISLALALAVWATLLGAPGVLAADPPNDKDPRRVCDQIPPTQAAFRLTCDIAKGGPTGPVEDAKRAPQAAGDAAAGVSRAAADVAAISLARWLGDGAAWLIQADTQKVIGSATTPELDPRRASTYADVYGRVAGVALALSVLLVLIGIIDAILSQRPGALRRVVVGMAVAGIGVGVVPGGTGVLMKVTDDLSWYVVGDQSQAVAQGLNQVVQLLTQVNAGEGAAAFALIALGLLLSSALLWLELVARESLIYLFVAVAPLACAAAQWPRLEGVLRRVLFGGVVLILSKLVISIALAVGFAVLAVGPGLETLLGGMLVLVVATLMPFATARVVPMAADELTTPVGAEELALSHQGRQRGWIMGGAGTVVSGAIAGGSGRWSAAPPVIGAIGATANGMQAGSPRPGFQPGQGNSANIAATATAPDGESSRPRPRRGRPRRSERRGEG